METSKNSEEEKAILRFERIERYLLGRMEANELSEFEQEMESSAQLRDEVEILRTDIGAIQMANIREEIAAVGDAYKSSNSSAEAKYESASRAGTDEATIVPLERTSPSPKSIAYAIAAGIAALVALFFFMGSEPLHEELFAEYYSLDPGLPTAMGISEDYAFQDAMVDYKYGRYDKASAKWEKLKRLPTESDTLDYYIALSAMESGNHTRGLELLTALADSPSALRHEAQWYTAMCYLKTNDLSRLEQLSIDPDSPYRPNYEALIKALKDS